MSVVEDVHGIADAVAVAHTPLLQRSAVTLGLPAELAPTLYLAWDGYTFVAKSDDDRMFDAEFGDGTQPARTPIRKALNQIRPLLTKQMTEQVDAVAVPEVQV